jgi:2-methylcitrate dehydratase PrpD
MASGGLPALAKLNASFQGRWGAVKMIRTQVAPAFEAVAATLTQLSLTRSKDGEMLDHELAVGYEVGAAVGKLRRLKGLALDLFRDGNSIRAVAQVRLYRTD